MKEKKCELILSLISLAVFFITLILIILKINLGDYFVSTYFQQIQNPLMNSFFIFIGNYSEVFLIALASFFIIFLYIKKRKSQSIILLTILAVGYLINSIIKLLLQRERPLPQLISETGFSFPSGHSVFAIILFSLIIYLYKDKIKNQSIKYLFITVNVFLIFLVGFSRIYLNVHWFTDVIGGYALGFFLFNFGVLVLQTQSKKFLN
jgi:undecaprenyl-diphosphatase